MIRNYLPLFILTVMLTSSSMNAQDDWSWAKSAGGTADFETGNDVATDDAGYMYVTGHFFETASFGPLTLTSEGDRDMFVAKYSPLGNVVWAKRFGGAGFDDGRSIAVDDNANVFVAGSSNEENVHLVKLDSSGTTLWEKTSTDNSNNYFGRAVFVDVDNSGNSYLSGNYRANITFDNETIQHTEEEDVFLVKYGPDGNLNWTRRIVSAAPFETAAIAFQRVSSMNVDGAGNCYLGGTFESQIYFDDDVSLDGTFSNSVEEYIVKYDTSGDALFATKTTEEEQPVGPKGIATDDSEEIYITGWFNDNISLGDFDLVPVDEDGEFSMYMAKLNSSGEFVWAKRGGNISNDVLAVDVALRSNGNPVFFADGPLTVIDDDEELGLFIGTVFGVEYTPDGTYETAIYGGDGNLEGATMDPFGNLLFTGNFITDVTFGNTTLSTAGGDDIYVAKYGSAGPLSVEKESELSFSIYPNPVVDHQLTIVSESSGRMTYSLIDVTGRIVQRGILQRKGGSVNLSDITPGTYFIRLEKDDKTGIHKIIVR